PQADEDKPGDDGQGDEHSSLAERKGEQVRGGFLPGVVVPLLPDEGVDDDIAHILHDDAQHNNDRHTAVNERRNGVEFMPGVGVDLLLRHSLDRPLPARAMSPSRMVSASLARSPGSCTPVDCEAVTNLSVASPSIRKSGPRFTSTSWSRP